jgi:hypothetical protein
VVCVTYPRRPLGPAAAAFTAMLVHHMRLLAGGELEDAKRGPSAVV